MQSGHGCCVPRNTHVLAFPQVQSLEFGRVSSWRAAQPDPGRLKHQRVYMHLFEVARSQGGEADLHRFAPLMLAQRDTHVHTSCATRDRRTRHTKFRGCNAACKMPRIAPPHRRPLPAVLRVWPLRLTRRTCC